MRRIIYLFLFFCSCSRIEHRQVLYSHWADSMAVLTHYREDTVKQKAAIFLINNMFGAYSVDSELLVACEPFYSQYDSLNRAFNNKINPEFGKKLDSLWGSFVKGRFSLVQVDRNDVDIITAPILIAEIDLAFKAWKENVYTRDCSFEDFCEYILPYRRMNGLIIDDSRFRFYNKHHGRFFSDLNKSFVQEADSLLYLYRDLTHSQFYATQTPIYSATTFERVKHGLCKSRCWYNCLLFSSLGMAVAIDFVPAWGNRNASHSWNVLMVNGESYAFEPFWDADRWKYKRIYNNINRDSSWGKFRLPKVYRYTYSNHWEGPVSDIKEPADNIPPLFLNPKKKDVSKEYFEVQDVVVHCKSVPRETHYGYLCVFGYQQWNPVQWGRFEDSIVTFKEMGRDIVYMPAYYQDKKINYLSNPFWVKQDGSICALKANKEKVTLCIRSINGAPQHDKNRESLTCLGKGIFWGKSGDKREELCVIPDTLGMDETTLKVSGKQSYRYICLSLPSEEIALGDLSFYSMKGKIPHVKVKTILEPVSEGETQDFLTDDYAETAFRGRTKLKQVDIDLGKEYCLDYVSLTPYIRSQLNEDDDFELFYWENGWRTLGKKKGTGSFLLFDDVPAGAIYMLKNCRWKKNSGERIFIYQDNHVIWM